MYRLRKNKSSHAFYNINCPIKCRSSHTTGKFLFFNLYIKNSLWESYSHEIIPNSEISIRNLITYVSHYSRAFVNFFPFDIERDVVLSNISGFMKTYT